MNGDALGLIETVGLVAAVTAADTCLKSANVSLVGYELTKGSGLVTVKISGNVSAVTAAISSAKVSVSLVGKVYSTLIIPRPSKSTDNLISTKETVGIDHKAEVEEIADKEIVADSKGVQINDENKEIEISNTEIIEDAYKNDEDISNKIIELTDIKHDDNTEIIEDIDNKHEDMEKVQEVCNLCGDPKCHRKKGMPRKLCIHYKQ